jgi:hypothetical protein
MLEDMAGSGYQNIVSWQPHGNAFRVHEREVFAGTIMPLYFNQTKYRSFQRQLNIYSFHRIGKGPDKGAYCHTLFIRNNKLMSLNMARHKIKKDTAGSIDSEPQDPHIYSETAAEDQHHFNSDRQDHQRRAMSEISLPISYPGAEATAIPALTNTPSSHGCWVGGDMVAEAISSKDSSFFDKSTNTCSKDVQSTGGNIVNATQETCCVPSDDGGDELFGKKFFVVDSTPPSDFSSLVNDGRGPVNYMPRSA